MVSRNELPDAAARFSIAHELDRTLFVEAGAGTGKTSSLVSRIVALVASGVPVGRIAAITFTEAAASELRGRVRDALANRGEGANDRSLIEAAVDVESAAFTTLHGFALRLLSDHPIEAGLPPGFSVADEIGSTLEFEQAWKVFLAEMSDDMDNFELFDRAAVLKVSLNKFPDIARKFDDNWDLLGEFSAPKPLAELDLTGIFSRIDEFAAVGTTCLSPEDKLAVRIAQFATQVNRLRDLDQVDQLAGLAELTFPPKNVGRKDNWPEVSVAEVRASIDNLKTYVDKIISEYTQEVIDHMVTLVAKFVQDRVSQRRLVGSLTFHDLLVLARQLLRNNCEVRLRLHQRYSKILLDEFQDTDPIQIDLAVLLATTADNVDHRSWPSLAAGLEPGRLVVVGDPKQSIYRFRRADMAVYAAAEEALVEETSKLTTNFRSVPQIISWVNHMFGLLMGDGEPGVQSRYTALQPYRNSDLETPAAVFAIGEPSKENLSAIRQAEAADVAAVICRAITGAWRIERDNGWQPLRLSDIAVLIPSRLSLPALETAFEEARIAYRPETSSLIYSTQEIRDVMAGIMAIGDPANAVLVVAALRSSLFAVSDEDLASWHAAAGRWDYRDAQPRSLEGSADNPICDAFDVLRSWHDQRHWVQPAQMVNRIVRDRRLREQALASARPRDRWRRYRFLAEQARHFTATYGGDLNDFIGWVEVQSSDTARVVEPIPPEPDDDSVRVLTIHGSKGLEFPMVIVGGAATQENSGGRRVQALFPPNESPQAKIGSGKTTKEFSVYSSVEDALDASERVRLDYVAATRARDILVMSAHHKETGRSSSGKRIWKCLESAPGLWERFERVGDEKLTTESAAQLRLVSGSYSGAVSLWHSQQDAIFETNRKARRWSATALAGALGSPLEVHNSEADELRPDPSAERTLIGLAVHEVLAGWFNPEQGERVVQSTCARYGLELELDEISELVHAATTSEVFCSAIERRHWRELYVSMPTPSGSLDGYIDLCYATDGGLVVVDYKTDRITSETDFSAKLRQYQHQIAAYVLMLEHLSGETVCNAQLLFVQREGAQEVPFPDLDAAKDAVASFIGLTDSPPL